MQQFEYRVVPAPMRGEKSRDAKTPADRFAFALSQVMNRLGREGWEFVRSDTLPSEERSGLARRTTVYHTVLVFRRALPLPVAPAEIPAPPRRLTAEAPEGKAPRVRRTPEDDGTATA
ncbi:MAG: DUF4177 domain-containing protein [Defluviimonas sp.]|uniref:DUF4177 domain-containing protein n=1 Tax=Albidovulum sp. TaxID=1872424 RepID=UPI001D7C264F|nr:DUF4177 domain-containing protein [Paracoccaceae bacterium]MCC0064881.1 DUF4177 domain-containing protein [Defluviimonas sp.]